MRIALNLKGLAAKHASVHLAKDGGEQHGPAYRALNPLGRVPALILETGEALVQSLAIIEYLEEIAPEPALLPGDPIARARARAFAYALAMDVQPHHNLSTLKALKTRLGADEAAVTAWIADACAPVFAGLETQAQTQADSQLDAGGPFLFGARPGLAEACLAPAFYAARRFGVDLAPYPTLVALDAACAELPAFIDALPERQPDAPDPTAG